MTKKIEAAIAALQARDPTAYREARAAYHKASDEYNAQCQMIGALGSRHYEALERHAARALKPHRIAWQHSAEVGSGDVNHGSWTTSAHLRGEVSPAPKGGKYHMHMRAVIPFTLSPRDADEFLRGVALLKAAADAMAEGGL